MNHLLKDLAGLSGLRDRQTMDFALVTLIRNSHVWSLAAVRLLRAVGPADKQRWLALAKLERHQIIPEHDQAWLNLEHLPLLSDCAAREAAIVTESVICNGKDPFTTLFPIDTQASVCSLLEVESEQAISTENQQLIDSVLRLYENLQSLLDYGEKDTLTELLNRKTFDSAFWRAAKTLESSTPPGQEERRANVSQGSYWLAVLDIDHFKRVNDNFGHLIGDEVLLLLARHMRNSFRLHDQLYRFGGEEFVVLMRCASHDNAKATLERFRLQISSHDFPKVERITISSGFTQLQDNDTPSAAFDRADKAVYYAKGHGRNQVCSYTTLVAAGELQEQPDAAEEIDFF